ncbi:TPA: hypothetical protein QB638_002113 [Pasteurella multocida]|nr:hypothetical protein [Pasteurella multocida]
MPLQDRFLIRYPEFNDADSQQVSIFIIIARQSLAIKTIRFAYGTEKLKR